MKENDTVIVEFDESDSYLRFITFCFTNVLISGVKVRFKGQTTHLHLNLAAPGIDRIKDAVDSFAGRILWSDA